MKVSGCVPGLVALRVFDEWISCPHCLPVTAMQLGALIINLSVAVQPFYLTTKQNRNKIKGLNKHFKTNSTQASEHILLLSTLLSLSLSVLSFSASLLRALHSMWLGVN